MTNTLFDKVGLFTTEREPEYYYGRASDAIGAAVFDCEARGGKMSYIMPITVYALEPNTIDTTNGACHIGDIVVARRVYSEDECRELIKRNTWRNTGST